MRTTPERDPVYDLMECLACPWAALLTVPGDKGGRVVRAAAGFDHSPTDEDLSAMRAEANKIAEATVEIYKGCRPISYQAEVEQFEFRDVGSPKPIVVAGPTTHAFCVHIDDADLAKMDRTLVVERSGATADDVWNWMSKVMAP